MNDSNYLRTSDDLAISRTREDVGKMSDLGIRVVARPTGATTIVLGNNGSNPSKRDVGLYEECLCRIFSHKSMSPCVSQQGFT